MAGPGDVARIKIKISRKQRGTTQSAPQGRLATSAQRFNTSRRSSSGAAENVSIGATPRRSRRHAAIYVREKVRCNPRSNSFFVAEQENFFQTRQALTIDAKDDLVDYVLIQRLGQGRQHSSSLEDADDFDAERRAIRQADGRDLRPDHEVR